MKIIKKFLFRLALMIILMEFVQLSQAYKSIKSLNYHRQKHWRRRPQWHAFSMPPRRRLRRGRFKTRYHHDQYPPRYYNHVDNEPFTIELELPSEYHDDRRELWRKSRKNTGYVVHELDDEEKRKIRIKVIEEGKSHVRLKISRNDNLRDENIVNIHDNSVQMESIPYSKTPLHRTEYTVPIVHSWKGG